jgi:hypothetical protein
MARPSSSPYLTFDAFPAFPALTAFPQ